AVVYKSIMLSNKERTPQVIRNALLKFGIDDDPESYTLSHVLPDKEMILPMSANVYYAVNSEYDLNFVLRKKIQEKTEFLINDYILKMKYVLHN
ncbi:ral guanine nucleotide dissociation stimulator-like 1, partial [Aphis craccivora]